MQAVQDKISNNLHYFSESYSRGSLRNVKLQYINGTSSSGSGSGGSGNGGGGGGGGGGSEGTRKMEKGSFNPCDDNGQMHMVVVMEWGRVVEVRKVGTGGVRCISL